MIVPFVESDDEIFLETIIPSRKAKETLENDDSLDHDEQELLDERIKIRITVQDLEDLKVEALETGMPDQTLIASILHRYATGRLIPKS